jgi:hypothetical protein
MVPFKPAVVILISSQEEKMKIIISVHLVRNAKKSAS